MKVLKNNYKDNYNEAEHDNTTPQFEPYPRKLICEKCSSELEYEKTDMRMGAWGCMYIDCPLCRYDNMLDNNENNITLTVDNIEFPTHFYHTSVETGAVDCSTNENIKQKIHEAINYFRNYKEEYDWCSQSGNLYIHVHRYEGDEEYAITLSDNFYTMEIPFESQDY